MSHQLAPSLLIVVPIEEQPYTAHAVLSEEERERVEAWIESSPRIRELVALARELENDEGAP